MLLPELHPKRAIFPIENRRAGEDPVRFPIAPWGFDFVLDPGGLSSFLIVRGSDTSDLLGEHSKKETSPGQFRPTPLSTALLLLIS